VDAPGAGKEPGGGSRRRLTLDALAVAVVALIAVGLAGAMLADEWTHPGDLWRDAYHDRNSHMLNGMRFALALKTADPGNTLAVPVDLVTASASGLDPHISVAAAQYQAARVARVRGLTPDTVTNLIGHHTEGRLFGLLGEARVNVLELNLELDQAARREST